VADPEAIRSIYEAQAQGFDAERNRRLIERPWLDRFLDLAAPGAVEADHFAAVANLAHLGVQKLS
jgi:hypothetical protein